MNNVDLAISNKFYEFNDEQLGSLPNVYGTTLEIFKHNMVNSDQIPSSLTIQSHVYNLNTALDPQKNKSDKILSLSLLAVSVAIIATAAILGSLVNPFFGLIAIASLVPQIASIVCKGDMFSESDAFSLAMFPLCFSQIIYVIDAFTSEWQKGRRVKESEEFFKENMEPIRQIVRHKSSIERGINGEIGQLDVTTSTSDLKRFQKLQIALKDLNKIEEFLNFVEGNVYPRTFLF